MYYRKQNSIPSSIGGVLNNQNVSETLAMADITKVVSLETQQNEGNVVSDVKNEMPQSGMSQNMPQNMPQNNMPQSGMSQNMPQNMPQNNMPQSGMPQNMPQNNMQTSPFSGTIGNEPMPQQGRGRTHQSGSVAGYELMQALYSGINRTMYPYVRNVVNRYLYEGSPVLRDIGPDKATVDQMIGQVLSEVARDFDDAEEINLRTPREGWNELQLLYNIVEALILAEIFYIKRRMMTETNDNSNQ